jgi:hypothetical protein
MHNFLIPALVGGEWSASRPGRFTPGERAPCTRSIGGWVDLDHVEKRKFLTLLGLDRPTRSQSLLEKYGCHIKENGQLCGR